jgi:hypothetical protein
MSARTIANGQWRHCGVHLMLLGAITSLCVRISDVEGASISEIIERIDGNRGPSWAGRLMVQRFELIRDGRTLEKPEEVETVEFAFRDSHRYMRIVEPNREILRETSDNKIERLPGNHTTVTERVFDGDKLLSLRGESIGELHTPGTKIEIGGSSFDSFYLRCIGWFVVDPVASPDFEELRRERYLPDVLRGRDYAISEEPLDGVACVRLQAKLPPGPEASESLWLSLDHNYMLLQREYADSEGRWLYQVKAGDPVEAAPGLWLPQACEINEHATREGKWSARIQRSTRLRLLEYKIGEIDAELFQIKAPEGAMIADYTMRKARPAAGGANGTNLPAPMIGVATADGLPFDNAINLLDLPGRQRSSIWLVAVNIGVIALLLIAILRSRRKSAQQG